jgi:hypothetical protein
MEKWKLLRNGLLFGTALMLSGLGLSITLYWIDFGVTDHISYFILSGIIIVIGFLSCLVGLCLSSTNKVSIYIIFVLGGFWLSLGGVIATFLAVCLVCHYYSPPKNEVPLRTNETLRVIQDEWEAFWINEWEMEQRREQEWEQMSEEERQQMTEAVERVPGKEFERIRKLQISPYRTHGGVI